MTNYLDDFLFIAELDQMCNTLVRTFLALCSYIQFPVSQEKTEFATTKIEFLGLILDGKHRCI